MPETAARVHNTSAVCLNCNRRILVSLYHPGVRRVPYYGQQHIVSTFFPSLSKIHSANKFSERQIYTSTSGTQLQYGLATLHTHSCLGFGCLHKGTTYSSGLLGGATRLSVPSIVTVQEQ